ncbi:MAG: chemotaxis protein MotB [Ignavibacteriae bacterium HGW-Ignavibacteriae-3]|nr:MAG: chemotaxis protein MotB [Ignavibacteriae bacterium HGW-Ignavibacteriae-3]
MSDQSSESAPVIKKVHKGHGGHHGGAWKVAYADFVTAMMALFIVLWVLGQSPEVIESVAGYFKDPVGFSTKSKVLIEGKANPVPGMNTREEEEKRHEEEKAELEKVGEKLNKELRTDTQLIGLADQVKIELVDEGLRIELTDSEKDVFFEVGTTAMKNNARILIQKIGAEISKIPNKIIVEGHTDSRQYNNIGTGYSNFELSSERALSAKRALVSGGLQERRIDEVRGYADTRLRSQNDPLSFINRRISITVKFHK